MRLPRIHPDRRTTRVLQASAVVVISVWVGWMGYLAAPRLIPGWSSWVYLVLSIALAALAATAMLGAILIARIDSELATQQESTERRETRPRHRAEQPSDVAALISTADAQEVDNLARTRVSREFASALSRPAAPGAPALEETPVAVAAPTSPAVGGALPVTEDDPRWLPAVRRLAAALDATWRPEDLTMSGRGVIELADLGHQGTELDYDTVLAFVGDYVMVKGGESPTSGRDWRGALAAPTTRTGEEQRPAQVTEPAAAPRWQRDLEWERAVRRAMSVLAVEIEPSDGWLAGRGKSQLTDAVIVQVPELGRGDVEALVGDYMEVRAGYATRSGRAWGEALATLSVQTWRLLVVDIIASRGRVPISAAAIKHRLDRMPIGGRTDTDALDELLATLVKEGIVAKHDNAYRYVGQDGRQAG